MHVTPSRVNHHLEHAPGLPQVLPFIILVLFAFLIMDHTYGFATVSTPHISRATFLCTDHMLGQKTTTILLQKLAPMGLED
jgi:hypothetical protein